MIFSTQRVKDTVTKCPLKLKVCLALILINSRIPINIICATLASGTSQPGCGGGCLKSRTDWIILSRSSMSPEFFWIWLIRDSNFVIACKENGRIF